MKNQQNKLVVFQNKNIRRIWHQEKWFYSVVDIVEVLTDSPTPRQYWGKLKDREFKKFQLSPIWVQLKLLSKYAVGESWQKAKHKKLKFGR